MLLSSGSDAFTSILLILRILCFWPHVIFRWLFGYCPDLLLTLTVSISILTIGKILCFYQEERRTYLIIKVILYLWYFIYSIYVLVFFSSEFGDFDTLDWFTFLFALFSYVCMFIVGILLKRIQIGNYKLINYYVIMLIYFAIGVLWYFYKPIEILLTFYMGFWFLYIISVYAFSHIKRGLPLREGYNAIENARHLLKILGFTIFYSFLLICIIQYFPEALFGLENWIFGLIPTVLFAIISVLYYENEKIRYGSSFLMLTFFSWVIADIEDLGMMFFNFVFMVILMIILPFLILFFCAYWDKSKFVLEIFCFTILYIIVVGFLILLLSLEPHIENWMVGLIGMCICSFWYIGPWKPTLFRLKKVWLFLIMIFLSYFLSDIEDFLVQIVQLYTI
ncbi:MAG: hypothetical protein ACFFCI_00935 [Promethearchaeota archaeon]